MTRSALVTGAGGFVGRRLVRALAAGDWRVTATERQVASGRGDGDDVRWIDGDVRDPAHLAAAVEAADADAIFHLAGVSFVPAAAADPVEAIDVNAVAAARLVSAVAAHRTATGRDPVVIVVGSGEQYGRHDAAALPLDEAAEQRPYNVYAASKVAQEMFALQAWRSQGVRTIATRSFNHSGPGQNGRFLLPGLVGRTRALRGGPRGVPLVMGNQDTVRDFLHVDDVVAAYIALADRGRPGQAYNVASGVGHSTGELARRVLARAGVDAPVEVDPALVRPAEVPALVGSAAKLAADTGWAPRRSLDDLLDDLIAAA